MYISGRMRVRVNLLLRVYIYINILRSKNRQKAHDCARALQYIAPEAFFLSGGASLYLTIHTAHTHTMRAAFAPRLYFLGYFVETRVSAHVCSLSWTNIMLENNIAHFEHIVHNSRRLKWSDLATFLRSKFLFFFRNFQNFLTMRGFVLWNFSESVSKMRDNAVGNYLFYCDSNDHVKYSDEIQKYIRWETLFHDVCCRSLSIHIILLSWYLIIWF